MTVNISARKYRIWVCKPGETESNGFEVTRACSGESSGFFAVSDALLSEDGLLTATGNLVLQTNLAGFSESFHPWENEARWAKGNKIIIKVADSAGALRLHPKSGLFILKDPAPPSAGKPVINLEIGDSLQLNRFRAPDEDASGIAFGSASPRTQVIDRILQRAGLSFAGQCPEYAINYPIPKAGGSWVEQAGKVAIGACRVLWQKNTGEILAKKINLKPSSALLSRAIGVDEAGWEPLQGNESPCEIVRATGIGYVIESTKKSGTTISDEYVPAEAIQEGSGPAKRFAGQTRESWSWSGNKFRRRIERSAARGLFLPDTFFTELGLQPPGSPFAVVTAEVSEEESSYEAGQEGKLKRKVKTSLQPLGALLRSYYSSNPPTNQSIPWLGLISGEDTFTDYEYTNGSIIESITTTKSEPRGKIAGAANNWSNFANPNPGGLAPSEIEDQSWNEQNQGEWRSRHRIQQAGVTGGSVGVMLALSTTKNEVTVSNAGQNQPPAAERRQRKFNREERQYEGLAKFEPLAGASYSQREHTHRIDYAVSEDQCDEYAQIFGSVRQFRAKGFRITTDLDDSWFNYEPLSRLDVRENGSTYVGIADGVSWVLAGDRAVVTANCMKAGKLSTPTPADPTPRIILPFKQVFSAAGSLAQGGEIRFYEYELNLAPQTLQGAIGQGGNIAVLLPLKSAQGAIGQGGTAKPLYQAQGAIGQRGEVIAWQRLQGAVGQAGSVAYVLPALSVQGAIGQRAELILDLQRLKIEGAIGQGGNIERTLITQLAQGAIGQGGDVSIPTPTRSNATDTIPYTPAEFGTHMYFGGANGAYNFNAVNNGRASMDGVIAYRNASLPTVELIFVATATRPFYLNQIYLDLGQFNGQFNLPSEMAIYGGAGISGPLLATRTNLNTGGNPRFILLESNANFNTAYQQYTFRFVAPTQNQSYVSVREVELLGGYASQ